MGWAELPPSVLEDFKVCSQELVEMGEEYTTPMEVVTMIEEGGQELALTGDQAEMKEDMSAPALEDALTALDEGSLVPVFGGAQAVQEDVPASYSIGTQTKGPGPGPSAQRRGRGCRC